jgi:hypothetical protein
LNFGSQLASIKTEADRTEANALLVSKGLTSGDSVWVGLTRDGVTDWKYTDDSPCPTGGDAHYCTLTSWWANTGEGSRCAAYQYYNGGQFNDWECSGAMSGHLHQRFLCNPPSNYLYVDNGAVISANAANVICQSKFGTQLASIKTKADRTEANALMTARGLSSGDSLWVGLSRDGVTDWRYTDGRTCPSDGDSHYCTPVGWWANTGGNSRCSQYQYYNGGQFNDWDCDDNIEDHKRAKLLCNSYKECSFMATGSASHAVYTPVSDLRLNVEEMQMFAYGALFAAVALVVLGLAVYAALRAWREGEKAIYRIVTPTTASEL